MGTACYVQGAGDILDDFRNQLGLKEGDTTGDHMFTVKSSRCVGACGLAPVLTINDDVHGKLNRKDVSKIIRRYKRLEGVNNNDKRAERFERNQGEAPNQH